MRHLWLAAVLVLASPVRAEEEPTFVALEVHADGSVLLDGRFIRYLHRIEANFQTLALQNPKPFLRVSVTDNVSDKTLADVLGAAEKAGLNLDQAGAQPPLRK